MKIKPFKALQPNFSLLTSPDSFSSEIKKNFKDFLTSGMIQEQVKNAFYIYRILDNGQPHTGLIAGSCIQDYQSNHIKKHEQTLSAKEQAHLHKFLQWNTTMKPILLVYPKVNAISNMLMQYITEHKPDFEIQYEMIPQLHQFWMVTDKSWNQQMSSLFKSKVSKAYIADGHHRIAATSTLHEKFPKLHYHQGFTAYFSFDEVKILPYNRVISGLDGISPINFMAQLSKYFKIKTLNKPTAPSEKHQINLLLHNEWYQLTWKSKKIKKLQAEDPVLLDSHLLNHYIFPILGITDPKTDRRISYVGGDLGIEGIIRKVGDDNSRIGFALYPVDMQDLVTLSNLDKTLPPKSTWFEPRLKNGIIMKRFEK